MIWADNLFTLQKCSACTKNRPKAHGAPIQCTKGKCPKAFHVSCARDGSDIVFTVLKEVEKEVVLLDPTLNAPGPSQVTKSEDPDAMNTEPSENSSRVLKIIRKLEVQVLCVQHNPVSFCKLPTFFAPIYVTI